MTLLSVAAVLFCGCSDDQEENADGNLAAPEVEVVAGATTISASWSPVKGADGYRVEITYVGTSGFNVDVAKVNVTETEYRVDALQQGRTYTVRIAGTKDGKASPNWFSQDVTTGSAAVTFDITPYESYDKEYGDIYYYAHVVPSDADTYYWVGAVTYANKSDAKAWIEDDIESFTDEGYDWDSLVKLGYIVKGNADLGFTFTSHDDVLFVAAALVKSGSEIVVSGTVSYSYPFFAEASDEMIIHQSAFSDFVGDWVVMPYGVMEKQSDGTLSPVTASAFNVKIAADGTAAFKMTGWGGDRNRFSARPVALDYLLESDGYNQFIISLPQDIMTESGVKWVYTSWFTLVTTDENGTESAQYLPYDGEYHDLMPSWSQGFHGYVANANKTVIKIIAEKYDAGDGLAAYMYGLWPCGVNPDTGAFSKFLNSGNDDPIAMFYLVRKDVADGLDLPAPDVTSELVTSDLPASATKSSPNVIVAKRR